MQVVNGWCFLLYPQSCFQCPLSPSLQAKSFKGNIWLWAAKVTPLLQRGSVGTSWHTVWIHQRASWSRRAPACFLAKLCSTISTTPASLKPRASGNTADRWRSDLKVSLHASFTVYDSTSHNQVHNETQSKAVSQILPIKKSYCWMTLSESSFHNNVIIIVVVVCSAVILQCNIQRSVFWQSWQPINPPHKISEHISSFICYVLQLI